MAEQVGGDRDQDEELFYLYEEGEGLVRTKGARVAYLRANGWVRPLRQKRLRSVFGENGDLSKAPHWKQCGKEEAKRYALLLFNDKCPEKRSMGRWKRFRAYMISHDLWPRHRLVPHGPAPWLIARELQGRAQTEQAETASPVRPGRPFDRQRLADWIAQAREGYEQERLRIEGIQQRASFILGASGFATAGVLANGGLLFGRDAELSSALKIVVGGFLMIATLGLAAAAYSALEATMIMFELAQPYSPWQVERRMKLSHGEEPRYILATTLLAAKRAEAVGDWKIRRLKRARQWFGLAIFSLVLGNLALLISLPFS